MSMRRRTVPLLFGLVALLWLVGCGGTAQPRLTSKSVGTLVATLILDPDPPVPMQDTTLAIELQDNGEPVIGAAVALTLTMPGCPMAPSHPTLRDEGTGLYRAQTVLTMSGIWQADARFTFPDRPDTQFTLFFTAR